MIGHARSGHSRKALDGEFDSPPSPPNFVSSSDPGVMSRPESWSFTCTRLADGRVLADAGHGDPSL
jgi:hypothetical protein